MHACEPHSSCPTTRARAAPPTPGPDSEPHFPSPPSAGPAASGCWAHLRVHTDVGVVHVNGAGAAQEADASVVNVGVGSGGRHQSRGAKHLGDDLPAAHRLLRHPEHK
eukprot:scaffold17278_cov63-Phaeocystis_antarctica.AAC.2